MCCTGHVISNFTYSWANDAFVQALVLKMQKKNQATISIISFCTTINVDQTFFKSENIKPFLTYEAGNDHIFLLLKNMPINAFLNLKKY